MSERKCTQQLIRSVHTHRVQNIRYVCPPEPLTSYDANIKMLGS
jgi:hypothetical protein